MTIEKMKHFLIKFAFFAVIFGVIICLVRFALPTLIPFLIALIAAGGLWARLDWIFARFF